MPSPYETSQLPTNPVGVMALCVTVLSIATTVGISSDCLRLGGDLQCLTLRLVWWVLGEAFRRMFVRLTWPGATAMLAFGEVHGLNA